MASGKMTPVVTPREPVAEDIESGREAIVDNDGFRKAALDIVRPAMIEDVKSMVSGRKWWLRASTIFETAGKIASAGGVVLAFASGSDIADPSQSQILGFTAGAVGTSGLVLSAFANFARTQSVERGDALNTILKDANLKDIPDITDDLVVQQAES